MKGGLLGMIAPFLLAGLGAALFAAVIYPGELRRTALEAELQRLSGEGDGLQRRISVWERAEEGAELPSQVVQTAADQSDAVLTLQKTLVELGRQSALELSAFAEARPPAELTRPAVAVEIEGRSDFTAFARLLAGLEAVTPRLAVSHLSLHEASRERDLRANGPVEAPVLFQLVVWGFWVQEEEA